MYKKNFFTAGTSTLIRTAPPGQSPGGGRPHHFVDAGVFFCQKKAENVQAGADVIECSDRLIKL
jgi:hypothetical protein